MKAAVLALLLFCAACGGALITASETLTASCSETAAQIVAAYGRGELTQQEALDRLGGVRAACEAAHDALEAEAGLDGGE